jgi:orotate phosphoribosyltransferase
MRVSDLQQQAVEIVSTLGHQRRDEPFLLASGQTSHDYIDGKVAVAHGSRLAVVARAVAELAANEGISFTAVGGLTMGADMLAHAVCMVAGCSWFSVRKEPKQRGHSRWIEGCQLTAADRVLLVDDVVTTGGSIRTAYEHVVETGATVVGAIPMVDRGEQARVWFAEHGIRYAALITYRDLGIEPIPGS